MNSVVTKDKDKELEEEKIRSALSQCRYPKWTFTQVKEQMANKQVKRKNNEKDTTKKSKGYVHISYVEGIRMLHAYYADMT